MTYNSFNLTLENDGRVSVSFRQAREATGSARGLVSFAQDTATAMAAVCYGRFYYLDDLLGHFGYSQSLASLVGTEDPSEAEVLIAVVREFGIDALRRLEGEYSLAFWDGRSRKLYGLRDPLGGGPLFWWRNGRSFGMTSALASAPRQAATAISSEYLGQCLARSFGAGELSTELTPLQHVHRVLPGELIELSLRFGIRRLGAVDNASQTDSLPIAGVEEAGEALRLLLSRAVQERVSGRKVAVHLSGGLDSTAIAAFACESGANMAPGWQLRTLSLAYDRGELAAERPYIEEAIQFLGINCPVILPADDILDYDLADRDMPEHDEPRSGLRGLSTQRSLVDAAAREGADLVLTGVGSDEILVSMPHSLLDSVRRFRWLKAACQARRLARKRNEGIWSVVVDDALSQLFPILCRDGIHPYLHNGQSRWPSLGLFTVPPWIRRCFAREAGLFRLGRERARQIHSLSRQTAYQRTLLTGAGDWNRQYLAAPRGVMVSHPFRDPRIIRFVLGLPEEIRASVQETKPVLRAAVRGLLPESIRCRNMKRGFDEVNGKALNRHQVGLERFIRTSAFSALPLIDVDAFCSALRQAAVGIGDALACDRLGQTLALAAWYERWAQNGLSIEQANETFRTVLPPESDMSATGELVQCISKTLDVDSSHSRSGE